MRMMMRRIEVSDSKISDMDIKHRFLINEKTGRSHHGPARSHFSLA